MIEQETTPTQSGCWAPDDAGGRRKNKSGFWGKIFKNKTALPPEPSNDDAGSERQTEHCMVCGETLEYHDKAQEVVCSYCNQRHSGHITCPSGHFICETCHNHDAMQVIEEVILTSNESDPTKIAELAMSFPGLPMLGCQHAYIAGGALMAALKNNGSKDISNEDIKEVFSRTRQQAHGGYCGLTGVCGITPALGACVSVLTGSRCGKDKEQRLTMELTSRVGRVITDTTGPSCCKAYVWAGLEVAVQFLQENLNIDLHASPAASCQHIDKHPHGCRLDKCSYYEKVATWMTVSANTRSFLTLPTRTGP